MYIKSILNTGRYTCCFLLFLLFFCIRSKAQNEPRYNRIQYHKYNWKAYHSKTFQVYFPAGNDSLCAFVIKELPTAIAQLKKKMTGAEIKEVSIIIYPSTDQQYETNVGAYEPQQYTLPTFVSKGSRIVMAYNGSYDDLKLQLYASLARQVWETQLSGNTVAAQAKGTTKSGGKDGKNEIPDWYKEGAIRFFGNGWTIADEDGLRNSFMQNRFTGYKDVLAYEPKLAGLAFCYFLTEKFMPTTVAQTFTQFKKKKNLSTVIRLVTKRTLDTLYAQCFTYYTKRFRKDTLVQAIPSQSKIVIPHRKGIVRNILINPAQDLIAYVDYAHNVRTVYIYDTIQKKTRAITSYPLAPWIDDHSRDQYPLLQWHAGDLYVAMPVKGKIQIRRYAVDGHLLETTKLYGVDGLTDMQPEPDHNFILAAYRKGQGDIVRYDDAKERYMPFTDDSWDDGYPVLTGRTDGNELYFVSDRPKKNGPRIYLIGVGYKKDTLYQGIYHVKGKQLKPVAIDSVNYIKWDKPVAIPGDELLVTHTKYGSERFAVLSPFTGKVTTLEAGKPFQYLPGSSQMVFYKTGKDSINITEEPLKSWMDRTRSGKSDTTSPWLTDYRKRAIKQAKEDSMLNKARDTTHTFLEQVLKAKPKKKKATAAKDSTESSVIYDPKKVTSYILQLHSAYFTAKVNNDYFINRYQPYQANQGDFKFPEVGAMAQGGLTDVLENHYFTVAYRIPSATDGSLFFIQYENTTKKVDWGLSYFRDVETLQPDPSRDWVDENGNPYPNTAKVKTNYYELFLKDPINYDCAFGLETAVRKDATIFLATDKRSLDFAPFLSTWSITTLSFTMNKLQPTLPSLFKGVYIKALVDGFKGFTQEEAVVFGSTLNVAYHQPLYKYITLVTQLHTGYSGGQEKILYNLGGEDNNVTPRVDSNVHFPQNAPYAFQTLITPFRGYYQNSLYGNEFLLLNADLYFPIFKTLIPIQTPLSSINNLQLGIFSDGATAKETWNTDYNPNTNKWLLSYGLSARTTLAGYPLRVDVAWPNNGGQPVWYFSLNLQ